MENVGPPDGSMVLAVRRGIPLNFKEPEYTGFEAWSDLFMGWPLSPRVQHYISQRVEGAPSGLWL